MGFKYNNKVATTNIKDKDIYNTMEFTIEDIQNNNCESNKRQDNKKFMINKEWFDIKEFSESFIRSFCVTVYKYQGEQISMSHTIFMMSIVWIKNNYIQH